VTFDPDDTIEIPAVIVKRRIALRHTRRAGTETAVLRGHSMRAREEQSNAMIPIAVFMAVFAPLFVWFMVHAAMIVYLLATVVGKLSS